MASSKAEIPFPLHGFRAASDIPSFLMDLRRSISVDQLMNSASNLHEYIEELFKLVKVKSTGKPTNIDELLNEAKSIQMFQIISSDNTPWSQYSLPAGKSKTQWTIYDELVVATISLSHIYNVLTLETLDSNYEAGSITDSDWKRSSNLLRSSFSVLNEFKNSTSVDEYHSANAGYILHLNTILVQLIVIFKNIYITFAEIDSRFGDFEKLPDRLSAYIKILIFIYNELSVLEKLTTTEKEKRSLKIEIKSRSSDDLANVKLMKRYMEIIYCYYKSLDSYGADSVGLAIGLVKYGLLNSMDQDPIKSKLKMNFHSNRKLKEKQMFKEDVILIKQMNNLPLVFKKNLIMVINLLKTLNVKFEKINNNIKFDKVIEADNIKKNYLFSANDLPTGMQVPLTDIQRYVPSCLEQGLATPSRNYF
ncbi:hypothetical protein CANARDRAFT_5850 [[Candida] arabinofermentans NRRL YB-2248]|uniref:Uncharacterized protein n=1 Tax=[Candida] arabinofermentans NRRL YB-2248 TaxID=983967 RepID=A0A1E4T6E7_9ASCO|nr:hypothetical protein CANARDRAFT_5850 [[Candida] arabinofermentans NRRL YB-2248]